ncbi:MAG: glycosyltransferase [Candidatus Ratteibacteria bacterium]|nr:glycosyltransferase [Candidatus Ratteibacteria bacterium]
MIKACRIVYLITELDVGGAENSLYQLVTHLNPQKFSPVVCSLDGKGKIAEKLRDRGIEVACLGAKSKFDITVFLKLIKFLKRQRPQILHTYLFHANFLGRIAGWICNVPIIISSVRVMEKEKAHHLYLDMFTQWMVDKEICVSKEVEKFMIKSAHISPSKLTTIYNGINTSDFLSLNDEGKNKKKGELSISGFNPVIGTIARLTTQKGIRYLLEAFRIILKDFPNCCLLIVGQGPRERELKTLSGELGISSNVKFLGFREDAAEIIDLMDVFVLPSLWEGMPNVVLEAYALGKPVVATGVGGTREIIKDGETGFLISSCDWKHLAQYVKLLIENPQMRGEFGARGREFVNNNFSLDKMIKDTETLYEELINNILQ